MRLRPTLAAVAALALTFSSATAAVADDITNNLDASIDAAAELMPLTVGGSAGTTLLEVRTANGDGKNGCNLTGGTTLSLTVSSSNTAVATVSPGSVTFASCGDTRTLTVTPLTEGVATVSLSQVSNTSGGTFNLAPATFTVNVTKPVVVNTAPSVVVRGVTEGAAYEFGTNLSSTCDVTDTEDGDSSFGAALSPITGPRAGAGLGSQTATCSYTDTANGGGKTATASVRYSIVDTTAPVISVTAPDGVEATGPLTPVSFLASARDAVDGDLAVTCETAGGTEYESGDSFPVGTTSLKCSATDVGGRTGVSDSFAVVVNDRTGPTVSVPANLVVPNSTYIVDYRGVSATDLVDGDIEYNCSPASGSVFPLGETTVSCSATDRAGNSGANSFTVTVQDKTAPIVTVPSSPTVEARGPNGSSVDLAPVVARDDVDESIEPTCDVDLDGVFPIGITTVTCSATDQAGNIGTSSFTVEVVDTTGPTITVPGHVVREATSAAGATVEFDTSAHDLVDGDVEETCAPESGTRFALGSTRVFCTAVDGTGNDSTEFFDVTVEDTSPPEVTVPNDFAVEATGPEGAVVSYEGVFASDVVDGELVPVCDPASAGVLPLGSTTVTCTATDVAGNEGHDTFVVTVEDTTKPVVSVPANVVAGNETYAIDYPTATATDVVDGNVAVVCTPRSGSTFSLGLTTVRCSATDRAGNTATETFTVEVQDTTKPEVDVSEDIVSEATGPEGAAVSFSGITATDDVDGPLQAVCDHVSGSMFPLGTTTVTCAAEDQAGNLGDNTFTITVHDTTAPQFAIAPNLSAVATSANGAPVTFVAPAATDLVDGAVATICGRASGAVFSLGTTTVTCTAKDAAGNLATKSFTVTVTASWSGILQPINTDGTSVFKQGSTVPVKFQLTGASAGVKDLVARLYYTKTGVGGSGELEAVSTAAATTGNLFRYDSTAGQYIFNLGTKGLSTGAYTLRIDLGDGVSHPVNISLK